MSNEQPQYRPGDIANGHILGADNQWYPLPPGTPVPSAPADPQLQVDDTSGEASASDWSNTTGASSSTEVAGDSGGGSNSGWTTGKKLGAGVAGAFALLVVLALAGGGSETAPSANNTPKPANTTPRSSTVAPTPLQTATPTPTSTPTPTPTPPPAPPPLEEVNYAQIDERTWQLIAKDPDSYTGQTFFVFGEVTQFDSATGTDIFRADVAHTNTCSYGFFDGDNTLMLAGSGVDLSNVVTDDVFAAKVRVAGSETYETAIGGSATVPVLIIDSIEVQPSRCS